MIQHKRLYYVLIYFAMKHLHRHFDLLLSADKKGREKTHFFPPYFLWMFSLLHSLFISFSLQVCMFYSYKYFSLSWESHIYEASKKK